MRVIKPGKLGPSSTGGKEIVRRGVDAPPETKREIWDDYAPARVTKKREYERGAGNRMVPRSSMRPERKELAP